MKILFVCRGNVGRSHLGEHRYVGESRGWTASTIASFLACRGRNRAAGEARGSYGLRETTLVYYGQGGRCRAGVCTEDRGRRIDWL